MNGEIIGMGALARTLGVNTKRARKYWDAGLVAGACCSLGGQRRVILTPQSLEETFRRIQCEQIQSVGEGTPPLSLEMRKALLPWLQMSEVPGDLVDQYLYAGAISIAAEGRGSISRGEANHYRDCLRACFIAADAGNAMAKFSSEDDVFRRIHPDERWLKVADRILNEGWPDALELSPMDRLCGVAVFALAVVMAAKLPGKIEWEANLRRKRIRQIASEETCYHFERLLADINDKSWTRYVGVLERLAQLPLADCVPAKVFGLIKRPCRCRISRDARKVWLALVPEKLRSGAGGKPSYYSQDCNGTTVECFGWPVANDEERARSYRRRFGGGKGKMFIRHASALLGIDVAADPAVTRKERLRLAIEQAQTPSAPPDEQRWRGRGLLTRP